MGRLFAQNAANTTGTQRSEAHLNISQNSYQVTRYYNYDSTGRVLQSYQNTPQGQAVNYEILQYDAAANLLNGDTSQGYVKHNRIQVYQDKRYYYDRFGRLAEKRIGGHTIQHFKYDAEHRITEIKHTQHQNTKYIRFKYDPIGRRIEKATYLPANLETPVAKTEFYWQGMRLLGEKQNGLTSYYIYDNGYNLLARVDGEKGKEK